MAGVTLHEKRGLLANSALFAALGAEELDALLERSRTRKVRAREEVFHGGDPGEELFAVIGGRLKMVNVSPEGKEILLGFLEAGEVFGEIAVLDGQRRTASVVAMEPCHLLVVERRHLIPYLERHPRVAIKLLAALAGRVRFADQLIEDNLHLTVACRLARKLLRLAKTYGRSGATGLRIGIKLSQGELANMVGATRESLNRQLRTWERDGLLAFDDGYVTLCRTDELRALAGFGPT